MGWDANARASNCGRSRPIPPFRPSYRAGFADLVCGSVALLIRSSGDHLGASGAAELAVSASMLTKVIPSGTSNARWPLPGEGGVRP